MKSINLFDKKYTGGLNGANGYFFEDSYILSQLPIWLQDSNFQTFQQELLTDLELFFGADCRWFIQIKNHNLTPSEFRKIISGFLEREETSEGEYEKYIIVSPRLSSDISILNGYLEKFRSAKHYKKNELELARKNIVLKLKKLQV